MQLPSPRPRPRPVLLVVPRDMRRFLLYTHMPSYGLRSRCVVCGLWNGLRELRCGLCELHYVFFELQKEPAQ